MAKRKKAGAKCKSEPNAALLPPQDNAGGQASIGTQAEVAPGNDNNAADHVRDDHPHPVVGCDETNSGGHASHETQGGIAAAEHKGRAIMGMTSARSVPGHEDNGGGQGSLDTRRPHAAPDPIPQLRELQAQRVATVKACLRLSNQAGAFTRRAMGWRVDLPEKERAKIRRDAAKLVKTIEATRTTDTLAPVAETVGPFVLQLRTAREVLEAYRKTLEKQMVKLAKTLPVWSWVANVQGLGELGLAIIVGEAGDLGNYANPGKLWKRMGLAPKEAYADVTLAGKDCHKIPRRRRSAMWTIGDAIVKQGYGYRELYLTRKEYEHEQHPEPEATGNGKKRYTPMHLHRRAQRYMEKRVLRDLLNAWSI